MKILVTGAAGFIGFFATRLLAEKGHHVVGLDNINDYYDPELKFGRLRELGIDRGSAETFGQETESSTLTNVAFVRLNLEDREELRALFERHSFDAVCHLAAQAGVRYSLENPEAYIDSNIVGFLNILENCRHCGIGHLVYASSSSVYGQNEKIPFETTDRVDHPISLYAATKKSNELMAHTYSHLYGFATTGLRFFTVYGPWGRPDMALFLFTRAILEGRPIQVFNNGEQERDFTYIDDIAEGVVRVLEDDLSGRRDHREKYKLYNIGNGSPVKLMDFIEAIEKHTGKTAIREMLPAQPGDVTRTWADTGGLQKDYGYRAGSDLDDGIGKFVDWYVNYYS
ncbi:NAD-dependent epimerase [Robiginitalea biformata]|uniref:Putative udp-glucuronic acid epimerase n=1 Tax=Robiginitalea biformata (strain ATCC BAA-864 / DSM 15991 / KCTC 12146 / HTCC2501) TaxID=313596 RepID=A4CKD8_ROBBH|nr:NAD-dependent epimerase [Robiginitalea biformata]EAR15337.1 putative udp-glucuronic acid epimerase [Robiginitalea biformata HTCC2501]